MCLLSGYYVHSNLRAFITANHVSVIVEIIAYAPGDGIIFAVGRSASSLVVAKHFIVLIDILDGRVGFFALFGLLLLNAAGFTTVFPSRLFLLLSPVFLVMQRIVFVFAAF